MSFWLDARHDLAELIRNPRRWWYRATHTPCPVCFESVNVGREWHAHKATHSEVDWRIALTPRGTPGTPGVKGER